MNAPTYQPPRNSNIQSVVCVGQRPVGQYMAQHNWQKKQRLLFGAHHHAAASAGSSTFDSHRIKEILRPAKARPHE